jgi:hypothetical protein
MFPCACSLRSTQCAALIALAAAAGISRLESVRGSEPALPSPFGDSGSERHDVSDQSPGYFQVDSEAAAPWLQFIEFAIEHVEVSETSISCLVSPPSDIRPMARYATPIAGLSIRQHSLPYAVGPPVPGITSNRRADCNDESGDSNARRTLASRIAVSDMSSRVWRPQRAGNPIPNSTGSVPRSSFALRGEPVALTIPVPPLRSHAITPAAAMRSRSAIL